MAWGKVCGLDLKEGEGGGEGGVPRQAGEKNLQTRGEGEHRMGTGAQSLCPPTRLLARSESWMDQIAARFAVYDQMHLAGTASGPAWGASEGA